jgi:hypothetical protein
MVRRLFTIGCAALRLAFRFVTPQCQFLPAPARPVLDDYAGTIAECGLQETLATELPDTGLERSIGMHVVRRSGSTKRPRSATAAGKRGSGSLLHPASAHRSARWRGYASFCSRRGHLYICYKITILVPHASFGLLLSGAAGPGSQLPTGLACLKLAATFQRIFRSQPPADTRLRVRKDAFKRGQSEREMALRNHLFAASDTRACETPHPTL